MKFKGLLLDIDHTIYNYDIAHQKGFEAVIDFCTEILKLNKKEVLFAFTVARKKVHIELSETAASHNRLLYFQKMLELLNLNPLQYSLAIYNFYWDTFLENMKPFDGIYDILEMYKGKICLVTDLTAHIQYRKIEVLGIHKYCQYIVTSEEAGKEKPHPYMFMMGLQKLNLNPADVCMIGDSFKKDIFGSSNLGIKSIWVNHKRQKEDYNTSLVTEVDEVKQIVNLV
jgi:HAD superfamily hydrolase (TIGR01549 family)